MRNLDHLVALRRRGERPAGTVSVTVGAYPAKAHPDVLRSLRDEVFVEPGDAVDRLDLRALIGLDVHVDGEDPERVRAVFAAVQRHHAAHAYATCTRVVDGLGRCDFALTTTPEGAAEWHA